MLSLGRAVSSHTLSLRVLWIYIVFENGRNRFA